MVKRYVWDEEGYPPDGMELVAASDYDALARDLAACKIARDGFTAASDTAHARIRELEAALLDLYSGTAEYVYLNHLGDPHNTTPMRNAAKVLGAPALEAYDRLARLTAETEVNP